MTRAWDMAGIMSNSSFGRIPSGATADRPASPAVGDQFYNGTIGALEVYTSGGWKTITIPGGNTSSRPTSPFIGQLYSNGELQRIEAYTGSSYSWQNIIAETPGVTGYTGTVYETASTNTITITGTNFASGAVASLIGTDGTEYIASTTTVTNLTSITAVFGQIDIAKEPYDIKVVNPSNLYGVSYDTLTVNDKPIWSTSSGSLGTTYPGSSFSSTVVATDEEGNTLTYSSSNLPSWLSLNSSTGALTGTAPTVSSDTTYSFSISASDGTNTSQSRSFSVTNGALDGTTSARAASSASAILSINPSAADGLYYLKNSSGTVIQTYCDMTNGGWVLASSNNASSSVIPGGNNRRSSSYWLARTGGSLGTSSPDQDWIIGDWLDSFSFNQARGVGFGYNSTNGTYTWANKGGYADCRMTLSSSGTSRYTEVIPRSSVTVTGNTTVAPGAAYFILDMIRTDFVNGGYTANDNQTTVGFAGVVASNGDGTAGTYFGHGTDESSSNSYEGWYSTESVSQNCQGYTTWVK